MDVQNFSNNQRCFINTLARLRESSRDAVVSADAGFTDPYTMYMHVDRPVQNKFVSILEETYETDHAELILLCGSVGDGKSHMLSYCKAKYPQMMEKFYIHNDSTASLYIDKPASYTLMKIMGDFMDEKLATSKSKVILAINLGTLSNFLEDDVDNKFGKLKEYVEKVGILDETIGDNEDNTFFHSVNFADYHMYELTPCGITSAYIRGILQKITTKEEANEFYKEYCKKCGECQAKKNCPIKVNYELLSDDMIQQGLVSVLVESIVKNKLIVSTRTLLNMIYEIVVDERYWDRGSLEPRKEPGKLNSLQYCEALLPNILFSKRNSSDVLDSMKYVDPMQIRNEKIDDFFVYYENSDDVMEIFEENLQEYSSMLGRLKNMDFADKSTHPVKEAVLRLLVRMCWLTEKRKDLLPKDQDYEEYMKALYAWNTGRHLDLKNVYSIVEKGVLSWNGPVEKDEMQLPVGNKKSEYHLIQKIQIRQRVDNLPKLEQGNLSSFRDELRLKYRYSGNDEAELDVDFALYKLLKRVINGYVPNINDKRVNVKCVEFINKISQGGLKQEQLYIRDLSQKELKEYRISFDEDFGYSFEVY